MFATFYLSIFIFAFVHFSLVYLRIKSFENKNLLSKIKLIVNELNDLAVRIENSGSIMNENHRKNYNTKRVYLNINSESYGLKKE